MKLRSVIWFLVIGWNFVLPQQQQTSSGMILKTDSVHRTVIVSATAIRGESVSDVITLHARQNLDLEAFHVGDNVEFSLTGSAGELYAESMARRPFEPFENDPAQAQRLHLLAKGLDGWKRLTKPGQLFPDFELSDQDGRSVRLYDFRGKVVAISFMYTRCALPNFCYRLSNNLGQLQTRFRQKLGSEVILLTITFDPVHDHREQLSSYARNWKAESQGWHFLTGDEGQIHKICDSAGVDYFTDEGLFAHSLHTLVLDRDGKLIANLEGNQFTSRQLGDLVQMTLEEK